MGLYQTLKRAVPLQWKVGFHKHKRFPKYLAVRVKNRLDAQLPIPPGKLIYLVAGDRDVGEFLRSGRATNEAIRSLLNKHGLKIEQFDSVLDFGCGVGRVMRHWHKTHGPKWNGTDYNPELINWCRNNLKFAEFRINELSGQLPYDAESFDFIYVFSVFTHLDEPLQFFWINELSRVLRPGGYLYFTTHGEYYLPDLSKEESEQFLSGKLAIREQHRSGENICAVFHPVSYVQEKLAQNLIVVDFVPGGDQSYSLHDVHFVRKPLSKDAAAPSGP
ncbi:MAG TPA: class I SAM-dependent methyltransferase [Pyrinomonadaceae bacterium]|nr:class I SAM-dependent methyltransferase [Pyrinomonadaceae bacterium]